MKWHGRGLQLARTSWRDMQEDSNTIPFNRPHPKLTQNSWHWIIEVGMQSFSCKEISIPEVRPTSLRCWQRFGLGVSWDWSKLKCSGGGSFRPGSRARGLTLPPA